MAEQTAKPDQASIEILVRGAEKMCDNAERLFFEAQTLAKIGATARALCLHQISLEECSKINQLGAWAVSLHVGLEVNQKKVLAAFGRHSSKNKHNAFMLDRSKAEDEAIARNDWKAAIEAFKQTQDEFHRASNDAKNASLYVDWADGEFLAPSERITAEMLNDIEQRNATFLGYAFNELKMFRRLRDKPDVMRELVSGFLQKAKKIHEEKSDELVSAMDELLADFFEEGISKLAEQNEAATGGTSAQAAGDEG
jgi:AbiV family abortive infection protein